jgi:hypothetical protein
VAPGAPEPTAFAGAAIGISAEFGATFSGKTYGPGAWSPRLVVPDALSTGGGVRTRQPLILVRSDPSGGQESLSLGWLDAAERIAKVRPLGTLEKMFRTRHHQALSLDLLSHARLLGDLEAFGRLHGIALGVIEEDAQPTAGSQGLGLWTMIAIVVAAIAIGVWLARTL